MAVSYSGREQALLGLGAVLFLASLALPVFAPAGAFVGWLGAAVFLHAIPLGALILLLMMQLIPGAWRPLLSRACESALPLLPLTILAFVPVLIGIRALYPWATQPVHGQFRSAWLTPLFFAARTILWFLFVGWLGWRTWERRIGVATACIGLMGIAIGGSLILMDWLMTLDPDFSSSGFGLQLLGVSVCAGFAAIVLLRQSFGPSPDGQAIVGSLFLTFLLFWAYFQFLTYFIVWSGNLAGGADWFVPRATGGWAAALSVGAVLGIVPLLCLLLPMARNNGRWLQALAIIVLCGKAIEFAWFALPGRGAGAVIEYVVVILALGLIAAPAMRIAYRRIEAQ